MLHISLYDLASVATLFTGLTLALLLAFAKRTGRAANFFLSVALAAVVLTTGAHAAFFLFAAGPSFYFYVRRLTFPDRSFDKKDLLFFSPFIIVYWMPLWLILISVVVCLFLSQRLIESFYKKLSPILMDKPRFAFRWLERTLLILGFACLLAIANGVFCFLIAFILLAMAVEVLLKADDNLQFTPLITDRSDEREKSRRLKEAVVANRLYEDAELTLNTLAAKLTMHPHDLSRIINLGLGKNFNDFINDLRVREIVKKMHDPDYDKFTLLGIAYESGFNSKTTFNRVFKEITGKTPAEYKKEVPNDKLALQTQTRQVILRQENPQSRVHQTLRRSYMIKNYLKIAWRNLIKNKTSSLINIGGLAMGMAVAIMIGLWIWDELSYDKSFENYDRIAMVMQNQTFNGIIGTNSSMPFPMGEELRRNYGSNFKYVVMSAWLNGHTITVGDKTVGFNGSYMSPEAPDMFALKMLEGSRHALKDPSSVLISETMAKAVFGNQEAMGKLIKLDGKGSLKVAGVYAPLPANTSFAGMDFIGPWDYFRTAESWIKAVEPNWDNNSFQVLVQLADHADIAKVSAKIKDVRLRKVSKAQVNINPQVFLYPMHQWHLYSDFKNGVVAGGNIQYVKLVAIIGLFVLLLACINFMNLSTARSEKRAKEVGIRKTVGSLRGQLIGQFYSESLLIAALSFVVAVLLVLLMMPFFNSVAGKNLSILWTSPVFWLSCIGFTLFTGIIAGSYPALYLSSFQPVKVLKGTFKTGAAASLPRKVLVVMQFTVSVILIIGTIVVFKQVEFAKERPVGYSREGLINVAQTSNDFALHFYAIRADLQKAGVVTEMAESSSPTFGVNNSRSDISWAGRDSSTAVFVNNIRVTTEYGKTVGWKFIEGRDFTNQLLSDSLAVVLNETAVKYMGFKKPIGQIIKVGPRNLTVIGVVKDMVMQSPYEPANQTIFYITRDGFGNMNMRINPRMSASTAISKIQEVCKAYSPQALFYYVFNDVQYATKFAVEERIGKLAGFFALLAIFISCIGLFGMASFMAEQRTKEIGIRKILGASVFGLWQLISSDFVKLTFISLCVAMPTAYYFMHNWLKSFTYRAPLSWWVFAATAVSTLLITLLTVGFQSIKAALSNPVKSLRSE